MRICVLEARTGFSKNNLIDSCYEKMVCKEKRISVAFLLEQLVGW